MSKSKAKPLKISNPYIIVFPGKDDRVITRIHPDLDMTHQHFGLLIVDVVRQRAIEI